MNRRKAVQKRTPEESCSSASDSDEEATATDFIAAAHDCIKQMTNKKYRNDKVKTNRVKELEGAINNAPKQLQKSETAESLSSTTPATPEPVFLSIEELTTLADDKLGNSWEQTNMWNAQQYQSYASREATESFPMAWSQQVQQEWMVPVPEHQMFQHYSKGSHHSSLNSGSTYDSRVSSRTISVHEPASQMPSTFEQHGSYATSFGADSFGASLAQSFPQTISLAGLVPDRRMDSESEIDEDEIIHL